MERSEPALVPEWLRSTGNVNGGGSSAHHIASSSSNSDVLSLAQNTRNRTPKSIYDLDSPRSAHLDHTSSANSWRSSSSNGSTKHAYSSFSRSHWDKDREREKERSSIGDNWDRDYSDPLGNIFSSRVEKDKMRRSNSMVLRKRGELLLRRAAAGDSKIVGNGSHYNGNGVLSRGSIGSSIQKAEFEKDFPSLGIEERQGAPDVVRVLSPGLSTGVQNLLGNSALVGGEGWKSALAEVPPSSAQQATSATPCSGPPNTISGLNMAEALAQVPLRPDTDPQLSVKTQRLEELAIKQSRQLIPMIPLTSKSSVLSSSDKSKPKLAVRTGEMIAAPKSGQQQLSSVHLSNQSPRAGHTKSDAAKTSHGKFLILKPIWENGSFPAAKEVSSPTYSGSSRIANNQMPLAPSASVSSRSSNDPKPSSVDSKGLNTGSTMEKRPSSQAQSRKDFLNLMRKKSSMTAATSILDSGPVISSPVMDKSGEAIMDGAPPVSPHAIQNGGEMSINGNACQEAKNFPDVIEKNLSPNATVYPEEEEAAFLRSLGWEENGDEDEGLTEEEISAFYQECMKLRPSLKLCGGVLQKLSTLPTRASTLSGASAGQD